MFHAHLVDPKPSIDVVGSLIDVFTHFYQIAYVSDTPFIGHDRVGRKLHIALPENDRNDPGTNEAGCYWGEVELQRATRRVSHSLTHGEDGLDTSVSHHWTSNSDM